MTKCYFEEGYLDTSVYLWEELRCGQSIQGPAIIIDKNRQAFSLLCCYRHISRSALRVEGNSSQGNVLKTRDVCARVIYMAVIPLPDIEECLSVMHEHAQVHGGMLKTLSPEGQCKWGLWFRDFLSKIK